MVIQVISVEGSGNKSLADGNVIQMVTVEGGNITECSYRGV